MNYFVYSMPPGKLTIAANERGITDIVFGDVRFEFARADAVRKPSAITNTAATQLQEYFAGKRRSFDVPIDLRGTPFQLEVWNRLREIPYGQTRTYAEIAEQIGRPKAFRAVGMANNKNPVPIIVPCHRVIGAGGKLVGYAAGLKVKRYLLEHEGIAAHELR